MSIVSHIFGFLPDGREVMAYTLKNTNGLEFEVIPYGCRLIKILTKDRDGKVGDIILGHDQLDDYYGHNFHGSFVGPCANRISKGSFELDGVIYKLDKNNGNNTVHSGEQGLHQVLWNVVEIIDTETPSIRFSYEKKDGECGFPGNLVINVTYSLSSDNTITMSYLGKSDKKTIFNPTNHSFFNLSGDFSQTILNTELMIDADYITEVNDELIPTGQLISVKNTPYDFSHLKKIGKDIYSQDHGLVTNGGYDHNYCLNGQGFRKVAQAYDPKSGRNMDVYTDMPGLQLYTFNRATPLVGKNGIPFSNHSAFCLETQFYPDSIHQPTFPFQVLESNKPLETVTGYHFSSF